MAAVLLYTFHTTKAQCSPQLRLTQQFSD